MALVLRAGGVGLDLLLIQRTEHPADPWSGHVAFPGGRADPDDVSLVATAIRETREEVGIDLGGAEHIGALDEIQAVGRMRAMGLSIAPHVFAITPGEAQSTMPATCTPLRTAHSRAMLAKVRSRAAVILTGRPAEVRPM